MSSSVPNLGTLGAGSSSNRRAYIKDPGLDPVIKMARDRRIRELHLGKQKRAVSGISGGTLHKQLELNTITKEILRASLFNLPCFVAPSPLFSPCVPY